MLCTDTTEENQNNSVLPVQSEQLAAKQTVLMQRSNLCVTVKNLAQSTLPTEFMVTHVAVPLNMWRSHTSAKEGNRKYSTKANLNHSPKDPLEVSTKVNLKVKGKSEVKGQLKQD